VIGSARAATVAISGPDVTHSGLGSLIDWEELRQRGWDPDSGVFEPGSNDPVFGSARCAAFNCDQVVHHPGTGLCFRCRKLWDASPPEVSFEEFCLTAPACARPVGVQQLCLVCRAPAHERPVRGRGLCSACAAAARDRDQTVAEYVAGDDNFPPAAPRPTFGKCAVGACVRWAHRAIPALCEPHERTWVKDGRLTGSAFEDWCARAQALDVSSRVVRFAGLSERARLEVLYGLHCASRAERTTRVKALQAAVNRLRAGQATSVAEVSVEGLSRDARSFLALTADQVALASTSPTEEAGKDRWDLRVFGYRSGWMHFDQLSQEWLRDAAKAWAWERTVSTENPARLDQILHDLGPFSESLRRHRTHRGTEPATLARADVTAFCNDLAHLEAADKLSRFMRHRILIDVDQFLREARSMGLTRPGQPMAGLPEEVTLPSKDRIRRRDGDDGEEGRALPQAVVDHLLDPAALERLEKRFDVDTRTMVELQARIGRRTGELCRLRWDCLQTIEVVNETGQAQAASVLVHDMPKVGIVGYQLPVDLETAGLIRAQQARVRDRFPGTPTSQLVLFPTLKRNPRGVKPFSPITFCDRIRTWLRDLPHLVAAPTAKNSIGPRSTRTHSGTPSRNASPTKASPLTCSPTSWDTENCPPPRTTTGSPTSESAKR
jgi:integrase